MIKKVAIFGQIYSVNAEKEITILLKALEKHNVVVFFEKNFYDILKQHNYLTKKFATFTSFNDLNNSFDVFFSIGGDGTILRAITYIRDLNIPILGINTGRLGFLANIQKDSIEKSIDLLIAKKYKIQERTLLSIRTSPEISSISELSFALNEITIARENTTSMIGVKTFLNNEYLTNYWSDGLIIAKPKTLFSEKEKFIIDQFIINGGKVFWLVDRIDVKEYLLKDSSFVFSEEIETGLHNLITNYGARINADLITDNSCAPVKRVDGMGNLVKWYFYPILSTFKPNDFNRNVGPIRLKYASSVDPFGNESINKTTLIETSSSYLKKRQFRITYKDLTAVNPEMFDLPDNNPSQPMGLLLEGKFSSNYKSRGVSNEFKAFLESANFKDQCDSSNSMVVIGDGDFIRNDLIINKETGQYQPVYLEFEAANLGTADFQPIYGNSVFFLNLVDQLMGNDILIPLRSRMKIPRLLLKDEINLNRKYWQFINLFVPSFIILFLGGLIWLYKRKKYNY